jgi:hypothetical protein
MAPQRKRHLHQQPAALGDVLCADASTVRSDRAFCYCAPEIKVMMSRIGFERGPNERIVINKSRSQASAYTGESSHPVERDTENCDY